MLADPGPFWSRAFLVPGLSCPLGCRFGDRATSPALHLHVPRKAIGTACLPGSRQPATGLDVGGPPATRPHAWQPARPHASSDNHPDCLPARWTTSNSATCPVDHQQLGHLPGGPPSIGRKPCGLRSDRMSLDHRPVGCQPGQPDHGFTSPEYLTARAEVTEARHRQQLPPPEGFQDWEFARRARQRCPLPCRSPRPSSSVLPGRSRPTHGEASRAAEA